MKTPASLEYIKENTGEFSQRAERTAEQTIEGLKKLRAYLSEKRELHQENKVYSEVELLPSGEAPDTVTPGCLVLEGGAFRGIYTQGVLDALMKNGINFQTVIGVSAGALGGINYLAGNIGRSARMNLRYRHDPRYVGALALIKDHGVFGFDFAFNDMTDDPLNTERFYDPRRRFVAVATNVETGKAEYFDRDTASDIFQAARASASMPYVSRPVTVDGAPYLDGGCSDKIPYRWAIDQGFEKIVVIKTQDRDFRKNPHPERSRRIAGRFYKNHPAFAEALAAADTDYNTQCDALEVLEDCGRVFVIAPSEPLKIHRLEKDMEKLGAVYYLGYQNGLEALPALRAYLEK